MSAKVLFEHSKPLSRPETFSRQCRPRFSFFCIKLSKNRQSQNRRKLIRLTLRPNLNHQNHPAPTLNLVSLRRCGAGYLNHTVQCVNPFFQEIHNLISRSSLNTSTKPKPGQRRRHNQFKHRCQTLYVNSKDASACRLRRRRPRCGAIYVPLIKTVNAKIAK